MKTNSLFLRSTLLAISITVVMTAPLAAQWITCGSGSTTCTNARVGVGTMSPNYPMSVAAASAVNGGSINTAGEGNFNVVFASGNSFLGQSSGTGAAVFGQGAGGGNILFTVWNGATNAEMMRIQSNGFVGVGTPSPTRAFDVAGRGRFNTAADAVGSPAISANCTGSSIFCDGLDSVSSANGSGGVASGGYGIQGDAHGTGGVGVFGFADGTSGVGVYGEAFGAATIAGYFQGNVTVTGSVSKASGSFKIDHPLDPQNKYLYHSFVESPDMMNIYNGNAVLDANGDAIVQMPDWFEALNQDFRYQLTCLHGYAPVYIDEEMAGNRFKIAGGKPGLKISWQVTGIRHDAWANAHRIPVEEEKPEGERGLYLHPKEHQQPDALGVNWEATRKAQATRSQQ